MASNYYIHNFSRMYLEEKGHVVGVYVDEKLLHINLMFGMGGYTTEIDVEDYLNDEEDNLKECTRFLIKELEKINNEAH